LEKLEAVLQRLQMRNLKVNAAKSSFAVGELEYLGYVITREGIKPDPKKIQAILNLERPKTKRDVRHLIGLVQYYRDLWERRAHILAPFSNLIKGATRNGPIIWTDELEKAFLQLKKMVVTDTMLVYPDFSQEFEIHTDASDYQLSLTHD
jgi:hypothetical protein